MRPKSENRDIFSQTAIFYSEFKLAQTRRIYYPPYGLSFRKVRFLICNIFTYLLTYFFIWYLYPRSRLFTGRSPPNFLCIIRASPELKLPIFAGYQETGSARKKFETENWFLSNDNFCIFSIQPILTKF